MNREDWIETRAEEIFRKWEEVYPVLGRNESALMDIALIEAENDYEQMRADAAESRAEALSRRDSRAMDFV